MSNIQVRTRVGSLDILKSEIVHSDCNASVIIEVNNLRFILAFANNDSKNPATIESQSTGEFELTINLLNFNNTLGQGILSPVEIGKIDGKKIYLSFLVWTLDVEKGQRAVSYSLSIEK